MPDGNLEIVRRSVQAAIDGKWAPASVDFDPGVKLDQSRPTGVYRGRAGLEEALQRWSEMWVDRRVEAEEFIDAGDQIIVVTHEYAKNERTGMVLDRCVTEVWTLHGGKVAAIQEYRDRDEALAAVGLADGKEEQGAS